MSTLQRPTLTKKRISWMEMSTSSNSQKIRITRRIVQLQQDKFASKLLDEGKQLCCEFVEAKLQREGLKRSSGSYWSSSSAQDFGENWPIISTRVQEVGWMLEECYPRLYTDISQHVNVPFTSEEVVHDLFRQVTAEIVSDGVNWARIAAVFQFAGALATECYKDSRSVYVNDISNWMYELTAIYLIDWIKRKGGWGDILRAFPRSSIADYIITSRGRWRLVDSVINWLYYVVIRLRESSRACVRTIGFRGE